MLAFDTCLDKTYAVLRTENDILSSETIQSDESRYHSAYLFSAIKSILRANRKKPSDIDTLAVNIGPGSFTGIRVCLTVAKVMSRQLNCPVAGISSLEILSRADNNNSIVVLDARRNKMYFYDKKSYGLIEPEEADKLIKNRRVITDDRLIERFRSNADEIISYQKADFELGEILSDIALEHITAGVIEQSIEPLYIQSPPVNFR